MTPPRNHLTLTVQKPNTRVRQVLPKLVATHFRPERFADFASGTDVCDVEVGRDAGGEEALGGYG